MQQLPEVRRFLGVDIGNSGLRLTELLVDTQQLGKTKRITWQHPIELTGVSQTSDLAPPRQRAPRYLPDDEEWLREIADYLNGEASVWMISSVRRDALEVLQRALQQRAQHASRVVLHSDVPIEVKVDRPDRVGIDRLLAAIAASALCAERPLIVIQAGSAVTVDLVRRADTDPSLQGAYVDSFEGGAIIPGVPMMLRLLGRGADQLPEIDADELVDLPPLPGRSTEAAMLCGAASALLGGVLHLVQRYHHACGKSSTVILSGGDGMRLAPYIPEPLVVEPHLVQRGLLILAKLGREAV